MSDDDGTSPSLTLQAIKSSFSALQSRLVPLLEREWDETLDSLDSVQRAKLDVLMAYMINNLIWGTSRRRSPPPTTLA